MSDFTFTTAGVERPTTEFTLIPVGWQPMMVESTEWVEPFQAAPGEPKELKMTLTILDGEFKNRKLWKKLKLRSQDPTELKKANGQLASLLDAIGMASINNIAEITQKPFVAKVGVFQPDGKDPVNFVNGFKAFGSEPTTIATAPAAPAKKPWE